MTHPDMCGGWLGREETNRPESPGVVGGRGGSCKQEVTGEWLGSKENKRGERVGKKEGGDFRRSSKE